MNTTLKKAKEEFKILEDSNKEYLILPFKKEILKLVKKFSESGQSGGSAPYVSGAISHAVEALCMQESLSSLTGSDDEWFDYSEDSSEKRLYQNRRLSSVFKDGKNGIPYFLNGIIWKEEDNAFTGKVYIDDKDFELVGSFRNISFPFTKKSFYVDVIRIPITKEEAEAKALHYCQDNDETCYYYVVKDKKQLENALNYFKGGKNEK